MATEPIPAEKLPFSDPNAWDNHAKKYDDAAGRSSRLGSSHLISLVESLGPSLSAPDARAIDLGAGTGSLAFLLAAKYPELPILATDISPGMLDQIQTSPLATPRITTQVADMRTPIGGDAEEGAFSHVFSTMAIQALRDPAGEGVLAEWARLLRPDGVVAIGIWIFDEDCGPHAIWQQAATAVEPSYVNPPLLPPGHWLGVSELESGLKTAGFADVKAEIQQVGFDLGKEGFMKWFWESGNPSPLERQQSFKGDLTRVNMEMERLLDEVYDEGRRIPLLVGLAVGRKPRGH
ncbi:Malonyl-[acyl-carrier protein] O-methyltransferase [Lachnellula suecica]|uniref:Malonyl-[acyl-carrier protein] O-methyltransferase n=1 Tax=Lachnellula suecica TaxID=602035 RepID=A0A8T9BZA5_9HELO|nr:Malonyl-[acyl-carrier protein] O-methyltransferase [Lachnellula suecica]